VKKEQAPTLNREQALQNAQIESSVANEERIATENTAQALPEYKYGWSFIDEEDQFDQLLDSLNAKGVREKKLQESLRKIRFSIKMKKSKKPSAQKNGEEAASGAIKTNDVKAISKPSETTENNQAAQESASGKKEEAGHAEVPEAKKEELENPITGNDPDAEPAQGQAEENEALSLAKDAAKDAEKEEENHHLFEDDQYEQTIVNAVWHNKTMPRRRKNDNFGIGGYGTRTRTRGGANNAHTNDDADGPLISLDNIKS